MILWSLNRSMSDLNESFLGCGIRLEVCKSHQTSYFNKFCSDLGLTGMLEAYDYNAVEIISPFLGSPFDEFCGLFETTGATKVFTQYVDTVNFIFRKFLETG